MSVRSALWPTVAVALVAGCRTPAVPTRGGEIFERYRTASVEVVRDAFTASLVRPSSDVRWIEATILDPAVVGRQAEQRVRLMGLDDDEVERRVAAAVRAATDDRTTIEVWLVTTCERCLDLRLWGVALRSSDGVVSRPRWVESEVIEEEAATVTELDVTRHVTVHRVRGQVVFAAGVVPASGVLELLASRPEGWDQPLRLVWAFAGPDESPTLPSLLAY